MTLTTPTLPNLPVFPLAGFGPPPITTGETLLNPVPLGVRLYSIINPGERWVTRWVDDISFRSVVPGGFASATITLRIPRNLSALPSPDVLGFSDLTELFRRIQVVDLRTMEVAWEGRIEDPARQVEPDTWQIGALGSMVSATDVQRPVFYIDSSMDRWQTADMIGPAGDFNYEQYNWQTSKDDSQRTLTTKFSVNYVIFANPQDYSWRWDSHGYDQSIARFTTTHSGLLLGPNSAQEPNMQVIVGIAENAQIVVDTFGSAPTRTRVIGTNFNDTNTRYIVVGARRTTTSYTVTSSDLMSLQVRNPKVLGMRQNRFGNKLTTAANYTTDYVTVAQVVEDVLGRFLVSGWYEAFSSLPWPGSVRPQDAYIDASNTTHILHLAYPDGATAADILNDLVSQVQPNAYWAIWESKWGASDSANDFSENSGFRFEYATWPNNWGYLATTQDGFEGQPNGDDVYNFTFYRYPDNSDGNQYHVITTWHASEMAPELLNGGFTRAATVNKSDPTDEGTAIDLAVDYLASKREVKNAGTLTVRRPIQFYDAGTNGSSGASRMVDPWMIRPGKLVRIADLPPRGLERDASSGTMLPSPSIDGTLFKVVATEYNSADNSCRLELDQVTRWQVPTQISSAAGGGSKTIRIQ